MEKIGLEGRVDVLFHLYRKSKGSQNLIPGFLKRYKPGGTFPTAQEAVHYVESLFREHYYELLEVNDKHGEIHLLYQRHLPWDSQEGIARSRMLTPEPEPIDLEYIKIIASMVYR